MLLGLTLLGCERPQYEPSSVMTEEAMVSETIYSPASHSNNVNVGFTTNGDLSFIPISADFPEKHGIVFRCQHGKF